jgi:hypothetical protein
VSENKCPMCGCNSIEINHYSRCKSCWFRCDNEDLPRIAAAMELAKTYVWEKEVVHYKHGNCWPGHITHDGITELVQHEPRAWLDSRAAKRRVLEVFNG